MILQELQELDLVKLANNQIYIVLMHSLLDSLALFSNIYSCEYILDDCYNDDMTHVSIPDLDIIAVMRSKYKWYTLNRFYEYGQALENNKDMSVFLNRNSWKWLWNRKDVIDPKLFEIMIYNSEEDGYMISKCRSGKYIRDISSKIKSYIDDNRKSVSWFTCSIITEYIFLEFYNKFIIGSFAIVDDKNYLLLLTKEHGVIAKKQDLLIKVEGEK